MATNPNYLVYIQQYGSPGSAKPAISITAPLPDSVQFDTESNFEPLMPQGITDNKTLNSALAVMGVRLAVQSLTAQLWQGSTSGDLSIELEFHTETDPVDDVRTPIVNLMKLVTPSVSNSSGFLTSPGPQLDFSQLYQVAKDALKSGGQVVGAIPAGSNSQQANSNGSYTYNPTLVSTGLGSGLFYPTKMIDSSKQSTDGTNSTTPAAQQNPNLGTAAYWKSQISNRISIQIGNYLLFDNVVITRVSQTFASNFDAVSGLPHHVKVAISFRPMFVLTQEDIDSIYLNNYTQKTTVGGFGFAPQGLFT
jgi:hypothetical protein